MEPDGFLHSPGAIPSSMPGNSVKVLTSLWNEEVRQAIDTLLLLDSSSLPSEPRILGFPGSLKQ